MIAKIIVTLSNALLIIFSIVVMALIWTYATDKSPLSYRDVPWATDTPLRPGDPINVRATRCNHTDHPIQTIVSRRLYNLTTGEYIGLPPANNVLETGCTNFPKGNATVPPETPPGQYRLEGLVHVEGNIRSFELPFTTQNFEVLAAPDGG